MEDNLRKTDKEVFDALTKEAFRQSEGLELIPSENYVSDAVQTALGSIFTNKYSEGYPGRRYYGGQENTDRIETLAILRAKKLFNSKFANVQPLSGAAANIATYFALLAPGDTILGMDLSHGGHLTHGHPVTYISKIFKFVRYGVKNIETGEIDYDELKRIAEKERPKIILAGFSSYTRTLDYKRISDIAREVGAISVADVAHIAGLIAGGVIKNPLELGFDCLTMTTHKTLRGPRGGMIVTNNEEISKKIDKSVFPGFQGGPHMNTIAAKAVSFEEALNEKFKVYARQVLLNAKAMERVFLNRGIRMIFGGTDNHMLLLDVWKEGQGMSGSDAEKILDSIGITVNKNMIPGDSRAPLDPSGIRIGTPAITTRGFLESDCEEVANILCDAIEAKGSDSVMDSLRSRIISLSKLHPVPKIFV